MKNGEGHHALDSTISYVGGSSMIALSFADIATLAQQLGAIVGCIVICIKLFYDIKRILQNKKNKTPPH
jgi:hypothetical protein